MSCYSNTVNNNGQRRALSHNYVYNIFTVYYVVTFSDFFNLLTPEFDI
jgi:hypothetical protein